MAIATSPQLHGREPSAHTRLLVVAPHPDDETIGAGMLIQRVREAGGAVRVLMLTDGDANPWPQRWMERRLRIGVAERARWGLRRREELRGALDKLGLSDDDLHALGWADMGLTALLSQPVAVWQAPLLRELDAFEPDLVVMPALADRHPDHGAAHVMMRLALAARQAASPVLGYLIHGHPAAHDHAFDAVDDDARRQANKLVALEQYRSQLALSGTRMRRFAGRPECFFTPPATAGSACLPWRPPRALWPWLLLTVVDAEGARTWRWPQAPLQRDGAGWRLSETSPRREPRFVKLHMKLPSPWIFDRWGWRQS